MKDNVLSIRLNAELVGFLQQTSAGRLTFKYDKEAKTPISIGMPIREQAYEGVKCEAFFGGLLPESEEVRKILGKYYHISSSNTFSLLKAIGYDCAGAISCHAKDDHTDQELIFKLSGNVLSEEELYQHIKALPKKPLFMDVEGMRLSLAGVQDKAAVCIIDNQIALPRQGCPTTHILKPTPPNYKEMEINEYFCMRLAKRIGLPVPNVMIRQLKDSCFLLVERYDRRIKNDQVERIHQEDFCQAMGILTSKKYQNEGGPGFKALFDLLKDTIQPAIDRNFLATVLIFNYMIGNMDAHGKNFSLLHQPSGGIRLAPFYDLISTRVYPELTSKMAMKIGNKYEAEHLFPRHWEQLCNEIGYRYIAMEKLIQTLEKKILKAMYEEKEHIKNIGIDCSIVDQLMQFIEKNIEQMKKRFAIL